MPSNAKPIKPAKKISVVEVLSEPAGTVNDDRAGFIGSCAWVIDGATDCSQEKYLPGESDAAWLADQFHVGFLRRGFATDVTLTDIIADTTAYVRTLFERERIRELTDRGHQPSAAALIARLRNGFLETASLGDCQLFVAEPGQRAKLSGVDRSRLGDRSAIARTQRAMDEHSLDFVSARAKLKPGSSDGRRLMNKPGGYGVLSIDMAPCNLIQQEQIPLESGSRLLLASDGFARLYEVFDAYSEETLLDAAFDKGLAALMAQLRKLEHADPACTTAPRLKPRDDATALLALVE